jgi:hypothetical protein
MRTLRAIPCALAALQVEVGFLAAEAQIADSV